MGQVSETTGGKRLMGRPARETPDVFSAIGHSKRRRIIELVAVAGSLSVGAIVSHFSESRQAISKHIGVFSVKRLSVTFIQIFGQIDVGEKQRVKDDLAIAKVDDVLVPKLIRTRLDARV